MRGYRNVNLNLPSGLISLPVTVANITSSASDVKAETCGPNGEELRNVYLDDKGNEVAKDQTKRRFGEKVVSQDELSAINDQCKMSDLDILEVCDASVLDNTRIQKSYWVFPHKKNGNKKAFNVFFQNLKKNKKAAIIKWTPSSRQQLLALVPQDDALVGYALSFSEDVRSADEDVTGHNEEKVSKQELELMSKLLDSVAGDGDTLQEATDDALPLKRALIDGADVDLKLDGESTAQDNGADLLKRLEAAVEAAK